MGKRHIRGSKGELRGKLVNIATQVQELSTIVAVLMNRLGGRVKIPGTELASISPDTAIDVKFDKEKGIFTLSFRDAPEPVTGKDIIG